MLLNVILKEKKKWATINDKMTASILKDCVNLNFGDFFLFFSFNRNEWFSNCLGYCSSSAVADYSGTSCSPDVQKMEKEKAKDECDR